MIFISIHKKKVRSMNVFEFFVIIVCISRILTIFQSTRLNY